MCKLNNYYPKETIIQYSCSILGKVVGRIIGALLLLYMILLSFMSFWSYASFVNDYFLPNTPKTVILGSLVLICAFAARGGVEVIGRLAELITPLLVILFIIMFSLMLTDVDLRNLFPIFGHGILPTIKASYFSNTWFSEFMLIGFFLPFLVNQKEGKKWAMISVLVCHAHIGEYEYHHSFSVWEGNGWFSVPFSTAVQYINIADFFTHLESLVMAFWIMGAFIKMAVLLYILSLRNRAMVEPFRLSSTCISSGFFCHFTCSLANTKFVDLSCSTYVTFPCGSTSIRCTHSSPAFIPCFYKKKKEVKEEGGANDMKGIYVFCLTVCMFLLSGCWDQKELNDLALIDGVGIDKAKDGQVEVTVSIAVPHSAEWLEGRGRSRSRSRSWWHTFSIS